MLISFRPKPVVTFLRFDYSIATFLSFQCWNLPFFDWRCFRFVHGQSVRRFLQFPIHFLTAISPSSSSSSISSRFFMITLLHFPLWSSQQTYNVYIYRYLVCHWWRDTPLNTNCAHFFPFEMTQTVSRLWNSNEITSHTYTRTQSNRFVSV